MAAASSSVAHSCTSVLSGMFQNLALPGFESEDADPLWDGWAMAMRARGLAGKTIRSRGTFFRSWRDWIGERILCAQHGDLEAWIASNADRWAPESRKRAFSDISQLYRWLQREGLVAGNPASLAWPPKVPRAEPRPASALAVADCLAAGRLEDRLAVALMAYAGLRCVEVARLRCGDIDLGDGIVWVEGKGGRRRFVFVNRELRPWLAALDGAASAAPVYVGRAGRAVTAATVSATIAGHARAAGHNITAHQFRHYYATRLYERCGDVLAVKLQMGHASTSTTEVYTRVAREKVRAAALMF
jgi:site-specific recombinase XerD